MSTSRLIKLSGAVAVASGAMLVIAELLYLVVGLSPSAQDFGGAPYAFQSVLFLLAYALLPGALVGFYAARSEGLGSMGAWSFLAAFLGAVLTVGFAWAGAFVLPVLAREAPQLLEVQPASVIVGEIFSFGLLALGCLAFGLAMLRSGILPRVAALLFVIGGVLAFFPLPFSTILFGVAVAWMGLTLLSPAGGGAPAGRSARVA